MPHVLFAAEAVEEVSAMPRRRQLLGVAGLTVTALLLAGCVPSGRVVSHRPSYMDDSGHPIYPICTQANGKVECGDVGNVAWHACKDGDYYNQDWCDGTATTRRH